MFSSAVLSLLWGSCFGVNGLGGEEQSFNGRGWVMIVILLQTNRYSLLYS